MNVLVTSKDLSLPGRLSETSLDLRGGELTCLIGPNGSGKTSLLHALAGIGSPSGEVRIGGVSPRGLAPEPLRHLLSYLPASRDLGWPLRARDVITLGGATVDEIQSAIERLELQSFGDRRMDQLSTGERSRVLIARALATQPRLLLLDEPISNLDPLWQLRLMDMLRAESRLYGQAALVAVHDLEAARAFADRLIIMADGRIAADGNPADLLSGPHMADIFGIERSDDGGWRPVAVRRAGPRSSP